MAYTKTVWKTGDVITAEKLNNLENGVEAAQTVIELTGDTWDVIDSDLCAVFSGMTVPDIEEAYYAGKTIVLHSPEGEYEGIVIPPITTRIVYNNGTLDIANLTGDMPDFMEVEVDGSMYYAFSFSIK